MNENYWSEENVMGIGTGISSSPIIADSKIIFGSHDTFIYALDVESGKMIWRFKTNGVAYADLATYNNLIYAGSQDGFLYCLDYRHCYLIGV
ncbi:PQQ-like beta-propeller repeat protein [archaeon]|nr:PQQ-like beta-propeller repeat protein [archaeon]